MFEGAYPSEAGLLQRARGSVSLSFRRRGEATVIAGLRQEGCLKARFPRPECAAWPEAVLMNNSGGVAAGDILSVAATAEEGARAMLTTAGAERFYRAPPGAAAASVRTDIMVAPGARLEYLPQATILFDGGALDRRLRIDLADGSASYLGAEMLVFGRLAMGETVRRARIRDAIELRRGAERLLLDRIRFDGEVQDVLDRPAVANGGRAVGAILYAAPDAEASCDVLRAALQAPGVEAGASAWDGVLFARVVARDGAALRQAVISGLSSLRQSRKLPRVWLC